MPTAESEHRIIDEETLKDLASVLPRTGRFGGPILNHLVETYGEAERVVSGVTLKANDDAKQILKNEDSSLFAALFAKKQVPIKLREPPLSMALKR